jgi:hypothetical protein
MAANSDENQGDNGYINIPVDLFRTYYNSEDAGFENLLLNILAWGFATRQIADIDTVSHTPIELEVGGPSSEILNDWWGYIAIMDDFNFTQAVAAYKSSIIGNVSEWASNSKSAIVGITFKALNSMLLMDYKSDRERNRMEHCWIVYLAIKSIIGKRYSTDGKCTWDNILNRALGFTSTHDNLCTDADVDWTVQYRCGKAQRNRKKQDMIKRLTKYWGVTYSPIDPNTGKNRRIPFFELNKRGYRDNDAKNVHHK